MTLLFALPGCLAAGWFELTRAMNGHQIAWVYAFEWPLFGVLGTYVWWRLVHDAGPMGRRTTTSHHASDQRDATDAHSSSELPADLGLQAWQRYLDKQHALDPPGKPSWQR